MIHRLQSYEADTVVDLLTEVRIVLRAERLLDDDLDTQFTEALALFGVYDGEDGE
jgi:hypothetical protein